MPQPQLEAALGFSITKRAPISSSVKSMTAFDRKGSDTGSMTTCWPWPARTRSSASGASSVISY